MLLKMYFVPADQGPSPNERSSRRKKQHTFQEWIEMRHKIREADIRRKTRTKAMSDFLRRVMQDRAPPNFNTELPSPSSSESELSEKS